jgi:large subunit ribosomal protein L21
VEKLPEEEGSTIELGRVLFIADEDKVMTGSPIIDGAKVIATIVGQGKGEKVIVFKYKPKVRYRRKRGHRQHYTKLAIERIITKEAENGT